MIRTTVTALVAAVVLLVPATAASAGASVNDFSLTIPVAHSVTGGCLGPDVTGFLTGTIVIEGQSVIVPSGVSQFHSTQTLSYRIDYSNGALAVGTETTRTTAVFVDPSDRFLLNSNLHDMATIFDAGGQAIGAVVINQVARSAVVNGEPRGAVLNVNVRCR